MAIADIKSDLTTGLPHKTCGACHALAGLSDDDAAALRALLADRGVKLVDLARALREDPEAPTIELHALSRHIRGLCAAGVKLR